MTQLTAAFLNCTLKPSPAVSNTETLANKVIEWFDQLEVTSEMIRVVDYNVKPGATSDEGDGDEWPLILDKIKRLDIIVIATPIWFGLRSSVAQRALNGWTAPTQSATNLASFRCTTRWLASLSQETRMVRTQRQSQPSSTCHTLVAPFHPMQTPIGWETLDQVRRTSRRVRIIRIPSGQPNGWP
jgi:hypothetical protein